MVSTTAWQSTPAVKPGPTATTTGASVTAVPTFRLARMASTTASGRSAAMQRPSGSASTGISPAARTAAAASGASIRTAVTSSTVQRPRTTAWEKQTVRRMAVGRGRSVMTTCSPARCSRRATPEAMSPAPRMSTSMGASSS